MEVDRIVQVGGNYYEGALPSAPVFPQFVGVPARNPVFVGREEVLTNSARRPRP